MTKKPSLNHLLMFAAFVALAAVAAPMLFPADSYAGIGQTIGNNFKREATSLAGGIFLGGLALIASVKIIDGQRNFGQLFSLFGAAVVIGWLIFRQTDVQNLLGSLAQDLF